MNVITCVQVLVGIIFLCCTISQTSADSAEIDNLAAMFESGLSSVSGKFGGPQVSMDSNTIPEVDKKMRELYTTIENGLLQARQAAAQSRSSMTTFVLEKLNLI